MRDRVNNVYIGNNNRMQSRTILKNAKAEQQWNVILHIKFKRLKNFTCIKEINMEIPAPTFCIPKSKGSQVRGIKIYDLLPTFDFEKFKNYYRSRKYRHFLKKVNIFSAFQDAHRYHILRRSITMRICNFFFFPLDFPSLTQLSSPL